MTARAQRGRLNRLLRSFVSKFGVLHVELATSLTLGAAGPAACLRGDRVAPGASERYGCVSFVLAIVVVWGLFGACLGLSGVRLEV